MFTVPAGMSSLDVTPVGAAGGADYAGGSGGEGASVEAGIVPVTGNGSRKNVGKGPEYPRALDWIERAGLAVGPAAYGVSKVRERRAGYAASGAAPDRRGLAWR